MITQRQRELVKLLSSEGLPLVKRPFLEVAKKLGLSEREVLELLSDLKEKGIIRRFGATVRHDLSGYRGNAMVAWKVPEERVEEVGKLFAAKPFVTHCYLRETLPDWPFNLYTMVHASSKEECLKLVESMAKETGLAHYEVLFTVKEVMRRTRSYFSEGS